MTLTLSEQTIILNFLAKRIELTARNWFRFEKASKAVGGKAVEASVVYWRNGTSVLKHAFFHAGGSAESAKAIEDRIREEVYGEPFVV